MKTKTVNFSYPTSPNAQRFGFNKTGCFTVELTDPKGIVYPEPLRAFATWDEAVNDAKTMPNAWDRCFLQFHAHRL